MKNILNPSQVKSASVKIVCGDDHGTAFYVTSNILLTALHVVSDHIDRAAVIVLQDGLSNNQVSLLAFDKEADICLITSNVESSDYLPLLSSSIRINDSCFVFGYPYSGQQDDKTLQGKINQYLQNDNSDFLIGNMPIETRYDYSGLSGGPVIINGYVVGVMQRQLDDNIAAISIEKIKHFLESRSVLVKKEVSLADAPAQFHEQLKSSSPNWPVFEKINQAIQQPGNWFLLYGTPGSGKSTIAALFTPENEAFVVAGKYFIKVPDDPEPLALRLSPNFFLETLENISARILSGAPLPKEDLTFEERVQRIPILFSRLSNYYSLKNQKGLFIIDGLDELSDVAQFLGLLPLRLPENIKILLSCTVVDILPVSFRNELTEERLIQVTPIDIAQCESFIIKEIGHNRLPFPLVQQVAVKSEGHPLYLRYLVNYILTQNPDVSLPEMEEWADSIPAIGGDISKYYNSIWDKIGTSPDKLWLVIILAHIRQAIPKDSLFKILPANYQMTFNAYFPGIRFLLYETSNIELYHHSFKYYVTSKTAENSLQANDFISAFCEMEPDCVYAINNRLYHLNCGSSPNTAVSFCSQEWADNCTVNHVVPELVMNDIKLTVNLAIGLKMTVEVIRLLLLLQRIEFRYNKVFAENADSIGGALIALGNYEAAIKYIVRDDILQVSNNNALLFLQLFYEHDAIDEADVLLSAIKARYRRLIEQGLNNKSGIQLGVFSFRAKALTLFMNKDFDKGSQQVLIQQVRLKGLQDMASKSGDTDTANSIENIRESFTAWQMAYILRRFDLYNSPSKISQLTGGKLDKHWAKMMAMTAIFYNGMNDYPCVHYEITGNYKKLVGDIEQLVTEYGCADEHDGLGIVIQSLIDESPNATLVLSLIENFLRGIQKLILREPNGVDLNYQGFYECYFEYKCRGYNYRKDKSHPSIYQGNRVENWEQYVLSLMQCIAYIEGKLSVLRTEKNEQESIMECKTLKDTVKAIDFTLFERIYWNNCYHLPELLLPLIYAKVVDIGCRFDLSITGFVLNSIRRNSKDQLGLYSEGYRECLYGLLKVLLKYDYDQKEIIQLAEIWVRHILEGVENRWERTPELLKVVEVYAMIGRMDLAGNIFMEMLKTSMGPGWYKEDQMDLLNTTLSLPLPGNEGGKYLKKFADLLEIASGEMTFQEYARYAKENFIESLIDQGRLNMAVKYFKEELVPLPSVLINNAENCTIDVPRKGDGYRLGARNITEAGGVLGILRKTKTKTPVLLWALSDIFIINDDTSRFTGLIGKCQAALINQMKEQGVSYMRKVFETVAIAAREKEVMETRGDYLHPLMENLSDSNFEALKKFLKLKGFTSDFKKKAIVTEETKQYDSPQTQNAFERFNVHFENAGIDGRAALIKEGTSAFDKESINIRYFSYSSTSGKARQNLKSLYKNDEEVITSLTTHINKYDDDVWGTVAYLLWFMEHCLSSDKIPLMYQVIATHFSFLITSDDTDTKYEWMESEADNDDTEHILVDLLIWLLTYPSDLVRDRAYRNILQLCKYEPAIMLAQLFKEALSNKPTIAPEKCSLILKEFSKKNQKVVIEFLLNSPGLTETIARVAHFSVKINFLMLAKILRKAGYGDLQTLIDATIPKHVAASREVVLEETFLKSIEGILDDLNGLELLNRVFCQDLIKDIPALCRPLSTEDFQKSDKYLLRSFYEYASDTGRFDDLVRHALNVAITPRVSRKNIKTVYEILN